MDTPPASSPLIPTTIPQVPHAPRVRAERAAAPVRVFNAPTPARAHGIRLPPATQARLDAHAGLHRLAEQELRMLPFPYACAADRHAGLAMEIADAVMKRVPLGGALPSELRLFYVQSMHLELPGGGVDCIAFNIAAWPAASPPPECPVTPDPHPWAWYPHDPLDHGGTELHLERAAVCFSGRFPTEPTAGRPGLNVRPAGDRGRAPATGSRRGCPDRAGCAPPARPLLPPPGSR
jgi:hypothetical protein